MTTIMGLWPILPKIQMSGDGFSGIVATGWVGGFRSWIAFRLIGGDRFGGIAGVFMRAAHPGQLILTVGYGSDRRYCSGPMIRFSSPIALYNFPTSFAQAAYTEMYTAWVPQS